MLRRLYNSLGQPINPATLEAQLPGEYPCSVHLRRLLSTTTLSAPAAKGSRTITVADPTGIVIGSKLALETVGGVENDVLTVKDVLGSVVTLDRTLDVDHAAAESVRRVTTQLNSAVGSPSAPLLYEFRPQAGIWRVKSMFLAMSSATEPALDKFGGIAALAYGIHVKQRNDSGRDYTFAIPFRSNAALHLGGGTYEKEAKVGTTFWTHFEFDFRQFFDAHFTVSATSSFCAAVQDDLSGLSSIEIKIGLRRIE